MSTVDRARLAELHTRERTAFSGARPRLVKWPGDFPVFVDQAEGAHFTCVDGIDHVDLCLGDTGAMMGHSPAPTVEAVTRQLSRGITTMLPTEDAIAVSTRLAERFGLPFWQFTLTATDAN
ncbi:MAG: aspartate aminotransferase family protein, partial [Terrabacter sp.]|nr:aspartate aminotransferase family protein [Terrabacter sp.]